MSFPDKVLPFYESSHSTDVGRLPMHGGGVRYRAETRGFVTISQLLLRGVSSAFWPFKWNPHSWRCRVRDQGEAKQHMKRRVKRKRKKASGDDSAAAEGMEEVITAADELVQLQVLAPKSTKSRTTQILLLCTLNFWFVLPTSVLPI